MRWQGMMGTGSMYRGQEMLSYANQRSMIDSKIDEGAQAWMHHSGAWHSGIYLGCLG